MFLKNCFWVTALFSSFLSSYGLNFAASYLSTKDKITESQILDEASDTSNSLYRTPSLDYSEISQTFISSSFASAVSKQFPSTVSSLDIMNVTNSINGSISPSSVSANLSQISLSLTSLAIETIGKNLKDKPSYHSVSDIIDIPPSSMSEPSSTKAYVTVTTSLSLMNTPTTSADKDKAVPHFHTPLMSLLVAPSSKSWYTEPVPTTFTPTNPAQLLTTSSSDNESSYSNYLPVPADSDHKKLLMLVLKAEDCTRFSKSDFEKMLEKLMAKFGFNDVIPEVSNAKCYSHLNINVTVGGATPTLRFLPNMDSKNNYTVDVLNRTFRIVKLEKVDLKLEKKSSNISSNIIAAVANHESVAYIAVGVCFGLILVICVTVCCIKCCCLRKPQKRYGVPKSAHMRLRPEDYTLTPIPRPTSLYVDYYRGSVTADIYSTTSAGSIASTTPTVEQGVVQPFDTSIVPLEDSSNLPLESSRDPSVESVPVQSDLKTFNIHSLSSRGFRTVVTDSKEQLNPKGYSKKVETKQSGVANPTFQRY